MVLCPIFVLPCSMCVWAYTATCLTLSLFVGASTDSALLLSLDSTFRLSYIRVSAFQLASNKLLGSELNDRTMPHSLLGTTSSSVY